MENRFGFKDFVQLVLLVALLASVWLTMVQKDRQWDEVHATNTRLGDLERTLGRIEARLDSGPSVSSAPINPPATNPAATPPPGAAPVASTTTATPPAVQPGRDDSWARPGVPVEWQPPWTFATDPRPQPDFQPGGEFTELFEAQPAKITPVIQTDVYGRRVADLVMESLAAYDPKTLRLRGVLADAWQVDPQGLWLRARIRDNARFSDGTPVTAEDLRWTFHDFIMDPQIEAERDRSTLRDSIKEVKALGDRVVEFAFFEPLFSNVDNALTLFVMPKGFYSKFEPSEINKSTGLLMGSGPYRLESLSRDQQWAPPAPAVLVRNEQYWGVKSPLARLRFKAIDQELPRLTEYKNGLADMVTPSTPQFVAVGDDPEWLKANRNLHWVNMRSGRSGIIWNCGPRNGKLTPFHDKRVRQAMTLMLDREKMVKDIWKGIGMVAKGFFNPGTIGDDPSIQPLPFDLVRGVALLKEAGWEDRNDDGVLRDKDGNPFTFEVTTFGGGEIAERIATFVKDAYAAAGIRVTIRQLDWSVGEPVRQQRDFDAMMMGWGANAPESDPKQIFHSASIKNQGDNFGQWNNPAADAAIDAARRELDLEKRTRLWQQFASVMYDDQPYTWIRVQTWVRFVKSDIRNVNTYPKGLELWEFYRGGPALPAAAN